MLWSVTDHTQGSRSASDFQMTTLGVRVAKRCPHAMAYIVPILSDVTPSRSFLGRNHGTVAKQVGIKFLTNNLYRSLRLRLTPSKIDPGVTIF